MFRDLNCNQKREFWLETLPNLPGQILAGGILQSLDLVEIMVVQFFPKEFERI